jgi:hypothetical protein
LHCLIVLIFPLGVGIANIEVVLVGWYEGRLDLLLLQLLPGIAPQPGVVFYFSGAIEAQPVLGFALYQAVDKVSTFDRPALRNLMSFNLDLLC